MQKNFETDDERPQYETFLTVADTTGKEIKIPARWLQVNPEQQIVAVAMKPEHAVSMECPREGYEARPMGLLSEQGLIFSMQITNSLVNFDWDFDAWPDPALILITPENEEDDEH